MLLYSINTISRKEPLSIQRSSSSLHLVKRALDFHLLDNFPSYLYPVSSFKMSTLWFKTTFFFLCTIITTANILMFLHPYVERIILQIRMWIKANWTTVPTLETIAEQLAVFFLQMPQQLCQVIRLQYHVIKIPWHMHQPVLFSLLDCDYQIC